jgi:hypothetical protein
MSADVAAAPNLTGRRKTPSYAGSIRTRGRGTRHLGSFDIAFNWGRTVYGVPGPDLAQTFPNRDSIIRLVGAVLGVIMEGARPSRRAIVRRGIACRRNVAIR